MVKTVTKTTTVQFNQSEIVELIRNKVDEILEIHGSVRPDQIEILAACGTPLANITVKINIQENE
jgi:hypothetical protein